MLNLTLAEKELAQSLAINHYNLSLSTKNPDVEQCTPDDSQLKAIFSNQPGNMPSDRGHYPLGFSRNILIIGAGASKNAYKGIFTATEVISIVYKELGVFNTISGHFCSTKTKIKQLLNSTIEDILRENTFCKLQAEKYFSDAFQYLRVMENYKLTLSELLYELKFEGALKILHESIKREEVAGKLSKLLNYRYIPNLFYEVVAHMFKHRFIDVIINLNFDELLDNAIEDEMGESDYKTITGNASCIDFDLAIIDGRLRMPLYLKPHGTISDIDSMLYSVQQYINLAPSVKTVIEKVFEGNIGSHKPLQQFNIVCVGYAFNDTDIVSALYRNLKRNFDGTFKTKVFIYDISVNDAIKGLKNKLVEHPDYVGELKQKIETEFQTRVGMFNAINTSTDLNSAQNINNLFVTLFEKVQDCFRQPFVPSGLRRHLFNCCIFTPDYVNKVFAFDKSSDKNIYDVYLDRAKANLLFDFLKFNGKIPHNIFTSDRAGKYYKLYLSQWRNKDDQSLPKPEHLKEFLKREFSTSSFGGCEWSKDFYESSFHNEGRTSEDVLGLVGESVLRQIKKINPFSFSRLDNVDTVFRSSGNNFFRKIMFSGSHEINPKYSDAKHLRFYPFRSKHVINTNLSLTWRFFEFVIKGDWDCLVLVGHSGSALTNLDKYQDMGNSHLDTVFSKGEVILFHSIKIPVFFGKEDAQHKNPIKQLDYLRHKGKDKFHPHYLTEAEDMHQMALFFKKQQPCYGIYFFKPSNKARINPVWFQAGEKNSFNKENLSFMRDLLPQTMFDKYLHLIG